jgi:hypothetical protein
MIETAIQLFKEYGALALAWTLSLFRATVMLGHPENRESNRRLWLMVLFLALMLTFEADPVYALIDRVTGVNNLSWLFAYWAGIVSQYFVWRICAKRPSRPMVVYLVITGVLLAVIFPFGPGSTPEILYHVVPYNGFEALYVGVFYAFAITALGPAPIKTLLKTYRSSQFPLAKARALVTLSMLYTAVMFASTKATVFIGGLLAPLRQSSLAANITTGIEIVGIGTIISGALLFSSNRVYVILNKPFEFAQKALMLRKLSRLRSSLKPITPGAMSLQYPAWWIQLRNLDFYIYRTVIDILDGRRAIAITLEDANSTDGRLRIMSTIKKAVPHVDRILEIPASASFDKVLDTCIAIA